MKSLLIFTVIALFSTPLFAAVGFHQLTVSAGNARELSVTLWYPSDSKRPTFAQGENAVFYGLNAQVNAPPAPGTHPLVLLSHRYGGNWRNLSWLAGELVKQGYIVAAPDHPGTTTLNRDAAAAAALWLRPHDLSVVLDALLTQPSLAGRVDISRIAAIGHSLGGWTVMAASGAHFSPAQFMRDCRTPHSQTVCNLTHELGIDVPASAGHFASTLRDKRIRAVVALDAGLTRGFTPESLAALPVPVLLLAAGDNIADLPADAESGWMKSRLPAATSALHVIPEATHFSFMQLCKPGALGMLEAAEPGEGIVCRDGEQGNRLAVHGEIQRTILTFLAEALNVPHSPTMR